MRTGKATSSFRSSLVPIALYPATSEREKISFNQLNKATGIASATVRWMPRPARTCPDQIIKGYEVAKGEYVEVQPEELEAVAIESKRTIDIEEFVPKSQIDELYIRRSRITLPRWRSWPAGFCGHSRSHPQGRYGRGRQGGFHFP